MSDFPDETDDDVLMPYILNWLALYSHSRDPPVTVQHNITLVSTLEHDIHLGPLDMKRPMDTRCL